MVRETVINYGNRKRLDSDAHTHASHRRMRKIQEVKDHFQQTLKEEKFYSTMLSPRSTEVKDSLQYSHGTIRRIAEGP
jgi:hypothetical protein